MQKPTLSPLIDRDLYGMTLVVPSPPQSPSAEAAHATLHLKCNHAFLPSPGSINHSHG